MGKPFEISDHGTIITEEDEKMEKRSCFDPAFEEEIVSLLPSGDLKAEIRKRNHHFTEEELLQIAYTYAPTFDERISFLERFSENASRDPAALAKRYMDHEKSALKKFTEESPGFIYELFIKEAPDSYEENYICAAYDDAIACIDCYYREYETVDAKETAETRYRIKKRRIFGKETAFEEDTYAVCVMGPGKAVIEISDNKEETDCDSEDSCSECKKICPRRLTEVNYPFFASDHSIIRYRDYEGRECFGVNLCLSGGCDGYASDLYVIPLRSATVHEHLYDTFYDHVHIALPLAELASVDDLDETAKKDYYDFAAYLDSRN